MKSRIVFTATLLIFFASCHQELEPEQIVFSSSPNGNAGIYIMDSDGGNKASLIDTENEEWSPVWVSKEEISFLRQTDEGISRHILDLVTGAEYTAGHPPNCILDDKNALYHPNTSMLLYPNKGDINIWDPVSNAVINLTESLEGEANYPAWGNDGKSILFTSNHKGSNDIYQADLNTGEVVALTQFDSNEERGSISPDGKWLLFSSDHFEKGNQDILMLDLETGEIINITQSADTELLSQWSGDGQTIYFGSNAEGNWDLYSYEITSAHISRLTTDPGFDGDPRVWY